MGSLPYARQDYEQLPEHEKTPELDFLILGKIPGGKQNPADPPLPSNRDFERTVMHCLIAGETEALNFLWRESGRDPAKTTVDLTSMSMDRDTVAALVKHGNDQKNLKVDLGLRGHHADVIEEIAMLVAEGKVNRLAVWLAGRENGTTCTYRGKNRQCTVATQYPHECSVRTSVCGSLAAE
jgi:hypothetical protein